jgi:hypothetical protein
VRTEGEREVRKWRCRDGGEKKNRGEMKGSSQKYLIRTL